MKRLKKIASIAIGITIIAFLPTITESCQSNTPTDIENQKNKKAGEELIVKFISSKKDIGECRIEFPKKMRKANAINDALGDNLEDNINPNAGDTIGNVIFIELPGNLRPNDREELDEKMKRFLAQKNLEQLLTCADSIGAELSFEKTEYTDLCVRVPEQEAINTVKPLIKYAKEYLYARNFTEEEIQQMILENNSDENALVPLVITLCDQSIHPELYTQIITQSVNHSLFGFTASASSITTEKVVNCAVDAILEFVGINDIGMIIGGAASAKIAIKATFKLIAKRVWAPLAAAYATYRFVNCLQN